MAGRLNVKNLKRGISYFKRNGLRESYYKAMERLKRDEDEKNYTQKVLDAQPSPSEAIRQKNTTFERPYLISILVPAYDTDEEVFNKMLESVASQTYTNWELCIADASPTRRLQGEVQSFVARHSLDAKGVSGPEIFRKKVKYRYLEKNRGISANLNEALKDATGDYVTFLDHDDVLTTDALYEVISVLNGRSAHVHTTSQIPVRFIYSDEDKVSYDDGNYFDYHKKTDFDPAMLLTNNYICHLCIAESDLIKSVKGFDPDFDGSQDYDLSLRLTEKLKDDEIVHIPKVLYHWRSVKASTAENPEAKLYAYEAGKRAIEASLERRGIKAEVRNTKHLGFFGIDFPKDSGSILRMSPKEFASMNEDSFKNIKEDYILVMADSLKCTDEQIENLKGPMALDFAGAATGKIIRGNLIESAGYERLGKGGISPCFSGLNRHFSGYLHRASLLRCVDAYDQGCVLYKRKALEWRTDGPELKGNLRCIYVPEAEFTRI